MAKETYYFQHDYEPTSDPKITALIGEFGAEGYGVFWRIIEMLHSNNEHKLPKKKYLFVALAKQMITKDNKIEQIVEFATNTCELFLPDENFIISQRVLNNFEKREHISALRSEAGKASASARWGNGNKKSVTKDNFVKHLSTKNNKGKENKKKIDSSFSPNGGLEKMCF